MKKLLLLILVIILTGCHESGDDNNILPPKKIKDKNYRIYIIDECEYISYRRTMYAWGLTHKGNCKNHEEE